MSYITTCTSCGKLYTEQSEEEANNPNRLCLPCFNTASAARTHPSVQAQTLTITVEA